MNTIQNFIDNPTPENFAEIITFLNYYTYTQKNNEGEQIEKTQTINNVYSQIYNYPIDANNFWHFVFKSPEHLNIVLTYIKNAEDFDMKSLGNIIFNSSHTSILGGLEGFDPLLFSPEQNQFLFINTADINAKLNNNNFPEFARLYWLGTLKPVDKNIISKFYDDNLDNPDAENLADAMMKIYEYPCLTFRKNIALYIGTSCILRTKPKDYRLSFVKKISGHELYSEELRESMISFASGLWSLRTKHLGMENDITPLVIGSLCARNAATYKFIKENEILVEKDFISNIIAAPKNAKVSKL